MATVREGGGEGYSVGCNLQPHCQMPPNPNPAARIKCWQSANHRYIHISTCHRLRTILTFLQNVSYHIHITCLWPDFHIGRSRGWRWSYTWQGCQASGCSLSVKLDDIVGQGPQHSNICKPDTTGYFCFVGCLRGNKKKKTVVSDNKLPHLHLCLRRPKQVCKVKKWTLTKCFLCLNLTRL